MATDFTSIINELQQRAAAIDRALEALRGVGGVNVAAAPAKRRGRPPGSKNKTPGTKRVLSPEGRRRIIEATKRRWAAVRKGQKQAPAQKQVPVKRRGMTAAGRKRLSELMKARGASKNPPKPVARTRAT